MKKNLFSILILGSMFCANAFGQIAKTGANDVKESGGSTSGILTVWAVPAEQKVRPNDPIETSNLIWSKATNKINLAGAGNEHVPFQVVISAPVPPGRHAKPSGGYFITASDFKSKAGKTIAKDKISFFLEHYVLLYGVSSPVGATGTWPDGLAPIKTPFDMSSQYAVVKNRPIWVDVAVPKATPAGIYTGTVTVTQNGKTIETLKVDLQVYGFSLPEKTKLVTYMHVSKSSLAQFYHKEASSKEIDELTQVYYDFLYAHKMEPWFNDQLQPEIVVKNDKVEVKFNDARYEYYMNKLKTSRVLLDAFPSSFKKQIGEEKFSPAFNQKVKSYISQVYAYFKQHGWQDHLVFNSPIDEPNTKEEYEDTRAWATLVHEAAKNVPFLVTESPVTDNPEWGTLNGYANNYSVHGNALNNGDVKKAIFDEQAKGGEMTWYISCDQRYPQPNYFIDAPAMDPVMVPWITSRYGMDGILYWAINFWSDTSNPWSNPVTFVSGFLCSGGYVLNGEGSLIYPGDFTKRFTGQPDVNGPVSSIRLELLREGIEDYDYISMLKDLGDKEFAAAQVRNLVIDVSSFSRNREELYLARKAMAKRLEELTNKK